MNDIRVAAVMGKFPFGAIEDNIRSTENWVRKAGENNSQIICFPELNITGYSLSDETEKYAEQVPGKLTAEIERIAGSTGLLILAGLIEKTDTGNAITHIAVSPDGIIGKYQKVHLSPGEKKFFIPGRKIPVFKWQNIVFGIGLCFDAHFPEFSTICSLNNAEIIFFPHASPPHETAEEKKNRWLRYLPARAYDNSVYVIACNHVGKQSDGIEYTGTIMILDPKGVVIGEAYGEDEKILYSDLYNEKILKIRDSKMGYFLKERSPEVYSDIINKANEK